MNYKKALLLIALSSTPIHASSILYKGLMAGICGTAGVYYLRRPDISMPTLAACNPISFELVDSTDTIPFQTTEEALSALRKLNTPGGDPITIQVGEALYTVSRGVQTFPHSDQPITIYSGGYSNHGRPYSFCVYRAIKAGNISGPCVVFENPNNTRRRFNFCQGQDQMALDHVIQEVRHNHPNRPIILFGACQAANNMLRYAATQAELPAEIKAIVAESPSLSPWHALSAYPLSHFLACLVLPNYRPRQLSTLLDETRFPSTVKVMIASLPYDTISRVQDMQNLVTHLEAQGAQTIDHFISIHGNLKHGKIGKAPDYQHHVQNFMHQITACE